ncbi:gluconate 5-dehydrogenase [Maribacter sp. ANRC-HE7]|uniref:Gluconate 5-dehydrogenase n=1 Tax=Maribacter aquimaris TaxID=2737171 RepID=A0ABR7UXL7_9FLAO|nr:gluconate 5-dehydrogenase [Maribacter aquimaris]
MAMAKGLGHAGAKIVVNERTSLEKVNSAVDEYKSEGIDAHGYIFDVTDEMAVIASIKKIEAEVGPIDILINNAGIIKRTPMIDMEVADFEAVIKVDLVSPFIVSKYVVKGMIERGGGKIINICSMMSELGRDSVSAYAAAKGGLKMLTKNMATEWAKFNIQTNGIGPGYFATSQTAPIRVDGHPFNDFIISRTPAARWGEPEDLAGAAIFLASKASNFVNGHVLYVDGGILATIGKPSNE